MTMPHSFYGGRLVLSDETMQLLQDQNPHPYIDQRILLAITLAWRNHLFYIN